MARGEGSVLEIVKTARHFANLNAAACKGKYQTTMETEDKEAEPVLV